MKSCLTEALGWMVLIGLLAGVGWALDKRVVEINAAKFAAESTQAQMTATALGTAHAPTLTPLPSPTPEWYREGDYEYTVLPEAGVKCFRPYWYRYNRPLSCVAFTPTPPAPPQS